MKFCIPVQAKNAYEAKKQIKRALQIIKKQVKKNHKNQFLIEIWLDSIASQDIKDLIKTARRPVIAVCRTKLEKGSYKGSEQMRMAKLRIAVENGAKFIDIGIHTYPRFIKELKKICRRYRSQLIISKHFYKNTPNLKILLREYARAKHLGADIVKIVTFVKKWSDNTTLFELVSRIMPYKIIAHAMGEKGKISRIGCLILGSFFTYIALDKKSKTAQGQPVMEGRGKISLRNPVS